MPLVFGAWAGLSAIGSSAACPMPPHMPPWPVSRPELAGRGRICAFAGVDRPRLNKAQALTESRVARMLSPSWNQLESSLTRVGLRSVTMVLRGANMGSRIDDARSTSTSGSPLSRHEASCARRRSPATETSPGPTCCPARPAWLVESLRRRPGLAARTLRSTPARGGRPLSETTIHAAHVFIHRLLRQAGQQQGVVRHNGAASVPDDDRPASPQRDSGKLHHWSPDEARRFLAIVADDRLAAFWTLALHTGMRRGELAWLRWDDVDLDEACTLTVRRTAHDRRWTSGRERRKTDRSRRRCRWPRPPSRACVPTVVASSRSACATGEALGRHGC